MKFKNEIQKTKFKNKIKKYKKNTIQFILICFFLSIKLKNEEWNYKI